MRGREEDERGGGVEGEEDERGVEGEKKMGEGVEGEKRIWERERGMWRRERREIKSYHQKTLGLTSQAGLKRF
jgi:hypothetical protein